MLESKRLKRQAKGDSQVSLTNLPESFVSQLSLSLRQEKRKDVIVIDVDAGEATAPMPSKPAPRYESGFIRQSLECPRALFLLISLFPSLRPVDVEEPSKKAKPEVNEVEDEREPQAKKRKPAPVVAKVVAAPPRPAPRPVVALQEDDDDGEDSSGEDGPSLRDEEDDEGEDESDAAFYDSHEVCWLCKPREPVHGGSMCSSCQHQCHRVCYVNQVGPMDKTADGEFICKWCVYDHKIDATPCDVCGKLDDAENDDDDMYVCEFQFENQDWRKCLVVRHGKCFGNEGVPPGAWYCDEHQNVVDSAQEEQNEASRIVHMKRFKHLESFSDMRLKTCVREYGGPRVASREPLSLWLVAQEIFWRDLADAEVEMERLSEQYHELANLLGDDSALAEFKEFVSKSTHVPLKSFRFSELTPTECREMRKLFNKLLPAARKRNPQRAELLEHGADNSMNEMYMSVSDSESNLDVPLGDVAEKKIAKDRAKKRERKPEKKLTRYPPLSTTKDDEEPKKRKPRKKFETKKVEPKSVKQSDGYSRKSVPKPDPSMIEAGTSKRIKSSFTSIPRTLAPLIPARNPEMDGEVMQDFEQGNFVRLQQEELAKSAAAPLPKSIRTYAPVAKLVWTGGHIECFEPPGLDVQGMASSTKSEEVLSRLQGCKLLKFVEINSFPSVSELIQVWLVPAASHRQYYDNLEHRMRGSKVMQSKFEDTVVYLVRNEDFGQLDASLEPRAKLTMLLSPAGQVAPAPTPALAPASGIMLPPAPIGVRKGTFEGSGIRFKAPPSSSNGHVVPGARSHLGAEKTTGFMKGMVICPFSPTVLSSVEKTAFRAVGAAVLDAKDKLTSITHLVVDRRDWESTNNLECLTRNVNFLEVLSDHNVHVVEKQYFEDCHAFNKVLPLAPKNYELYPPRGIMLFFGEMVGFEPNRLMNALRGRKIWVTCATTPEVDEKMKDPKEWSGPSAPSATLWSQFSRYSYDKEMLSLAPGSVNVRILTIDEQTTKLSPSIVTQTVRTVGKIQINPKIAAFARTFYILTDKPEEYSASEGRFEACTFAQFLETELPKFLELSH